MVSKRVKQVAIVMISQTACVAVGLWMQHQFATASVHRAATKQALIDLDTRAKQRQEDLAAISFGTLASDPTTKSRARNLLERIAPTGGGALIVDRDWRLVLASQNYPDVTTAPITIGQRLDWKKNENLHQTNAKVSQGILGFTTGKHLASARALNDDLGYVVVHRPITGLVHSTTSMIQSLSWLSAITFLWTCSLLVSVVYLLLTRFHDDVKRERQQAAADTLQGIQNLVRTRDAVIFGLAKLADSRDPETGEHLERISIYSTTLALAMQRHTAYANIISSSFIRLIGISSALHDIGKVGIEDNILRKPGPLTPEQRETMKTHTNIGGVCLQEIEQRLGSSNFLQMAREIALAHHERWDGQGYPRGLAGQTIPLAARIVAIADVYDALSSKRVYKPGFPHEECVEAIRSDSGKSFDPDLVEIWLSIEHKFRTIAMQYTSTPPEEKCNETQPNNEIDLHLREKALAPTPTI